MQEDNFVLSLALFAVIISAVGLGFNYYSQQGITGFATYQDTGKVNITISSNLQIRFQTDYKLIEWGSGYVNTSNGNYKAILDTATGDVINGTWVNTSAKGFVVENTGNVNCSLYLLTGKDNATYFGGDPSTRSYKYNVTNNETDSCTANTGFTLGTWYDVNTTASYGTKVCSNLSFDDTRDQIKIDIQLVVPSDSNVGTFTDTVTATAEA